MPGILDIYQNCKNITAVRKAFAALNRQLDARKNAHVAELRSILLTESREAKGQALEKTKADIDKYLRDVEYWNQFEEPEASEVRRLQRIPCRQVLQEIFNGKFIELKNGMLRYKR